MGFLSFRFVRVPTIAMFCSILFALPACGGWQPAGAPERSISESASGGRPVTRLSSGEENYIVERIWDDAQFGFVRIEDAEAGAAPNNHPVQFAPEQIQAVLAELRIDKKDDGEPVFTERELKTISKHLAKALAKAGPRDDVTFASTGRTGLEINFLKPKRLTTGRMFFRDDQLNVIFGIIHGEFRDDLRGAGILRPYTPGSRDRQLESRWVVVPSDALLYANLQRADWIRIGSLPAAPAVALSQGAPKPVTLTPQPVPSVTAPAVAPTYAPSSTPSAGSVATTSTTTGRTTTPGVTTSRTQQPAPVTAQTSQPRARTTPSAPATGSSTYTGSAKHYQDIEDRLKGLQRLRQQGLITEQEYQEKRGALLKKL